MPKTAYAVLSKRDVVGFTTVAVVTIRLIPEAASAGPSVVWMWLLAAFVFFAPVSVATVLLSQRHPGAGGVYAWTKTAFGDLHGFMSAWTYWTSSLVFFPTVLIFTSSQAAYIIPGTRHLAENQTFLNSISLASIVLVLLANLTGTRIATWFHNVSAIAIFITLLVVVGIAVICGFQQGTSTDFAPHEFVPKLSGLEDLLFFSSIVYMLSGAECASQLGDEVQDATRTIPRALLVSGVLITAIYMVASIALLAAVPSAELSGLKGFATAVTLSTQRVAGDAASQWMTSLMATLLFVGHLGTFSVWLAATARLPFVIGLDHYLPAAFGRLHPRFGSPYLALITLAAATAVLVLLSNLGGAAEQVYRALISLEIAIYFIPYLYLFAALAKLTASEWSRTPGSSRRRQWSAAIASFVGFTVTATSLALALIPNHEIKNPKKFYVMVFGSLSINLAFGLGVYFAGKRLRERPGSDPALR